MILQITFFCTCASRALVIIRILPLLLRAAFTASSEFPSFKFSTISPTFFVQLLFCTCAFLHPWPLRNLETISAADRNRILPNKQIFRLEKISCSPLSAISYKVEGAQRHCLEAMLCQDHRIPCTPNYRYLHFSSRFTSGTQYWRGSATYISR